MRGYKSSLKPFYLEIPMFIRAICLFVVTFLFALGVGSSGVQGKLVDDGTCDNRCRERTHIHFCGGTNGGAFQDPDCKFCAVVNTYGCVKKAADTGTALACVATDDWNTYFTFPASIPACSCTNRHASEAAGWGAQTGAGSYLRSRCQ